MAGHDASGRGSEAVAGAAFRPGERGTRYRQGLVSEVLNLDRRCARYLTMTMPRSIAPATKGLVGEGTMAMTRPCPPGPVGELQAMVSRAARADAKANGR